MPRGGNVTRLIGPDDMPTLRLITFTDTSGETSLRFCETTTGLLVGLTDTRWVKAGLLVSQLRGVSYRARLPARRLLPWRPVQLEPGAREPRRRPGRRRLSPDRAPHSRAESTWKKQRPFSGLQGAHRAFSWEVERL